MCVCLLIDTHIWDFLFGLKYTAVCVFSSVNSTAEKHKFRIGETFTQKKRIGETKYEPKHTAVYFEQK